MSCIATCMPNVSDRPTDGLTFQFPKTQNHRWYEFLTSLFGIIGGTFQVVGLVDHLLYRALKSDQRRL